MAPQLTETKALSERRPFVCMTFAINSLHQLGFVRLSPHTYKHNSCASVCFIKDSPLFVKSVVYDCALRSQVDFACKKLLSALPNSSANSEYGVQELWMDPLLRLSRKKDTLTFRQFRSLLLFFVNQVPTYDVLHRWGYSVDPLCPLCGQVDTQAHRVFACPFFAPQRAALFGPLVEDAFHRDPLCAFYAYGWALNPSRHINARASIDIELTYIKDGLMVEPCLL